MADGLFTIELVKVRVLIVDDDDGMRETLADILVTLGYDVVKASDGYHAIDHVNKHDTDVAFIDVRMPGISGVETYLHIKKKKPDFAAFLMTAYATNDQVAKAIDAGVLGIMYKPLNIDRLLVLLDRIDKARA